MSFLQNLPNLHSINDLEMQLYTLQLRTMLETFSTQVLTNNPQPIYIEQATEPNQSQWEAAWAAAGYTGDIPPTAVLLWKNTSTGVIGGVYGTTPTSSTVIARSRQYNRGGSLWWSDTESSAQSSSAAIGINNSLHPSVTITLPVVCDLILEFELWTVLSSGTGTWGADFLLDSEKVGTAYNSLPSNVGIMNISSTGLLRVKAHIQNVAAGSHTVQAIFGVTGSPASPPTIAYGGIGAGAGQYGLRTLIVRGVIK